MKRIFIFIFIMTLFVISSCKKSEVMTDLTTKPFQFKTQAISVETIKTIALQLKEKGVLKQRGGSESFSSVRSHSQNQLLYEGRTPVSEEEIATIIDPLVVNGRQLHSELVAYVLNSEEWNELTESERNEILFMSDGQLADLSLTYAGAIQVNSLGDAIKDCVGVALGIRGLSSLLTQLVAAPTVKTAVGLLKFVGKRYLGYLAIGWMIWDFADCMSHFE